MEEYTNTKNNKFDLTSLADDVYSDKIAKDLNKIINKRYKESDTGLYSTGESGCTLPYQY